MPRLLLLALLCVLAASASAQRNVIPNAGFDTWTSLDPVRWVAGNAADGSFRTIDPVGGARSGPFAMQMTVVPTPGPVAFPITPGVTTCEGPCRDDDGNTFEQATFPVDKRYDAFCGYYKASLLSGDKILLGPALHVGEAPIGVLDQASGDGFLTENAADWTFFIKPFTYTNEQTPTLGTISLSIVAGSFPSQDVPAIGSTAILDDLFFCSTDGTPVDDGGGTNESGGALLILDDATEPSFADQNVEGLLVSLGFEVMLVSDESATANDADGKALILISSSVDPTAFTADFSATAIPLIVWEADLYDDLNLAASPGTTAPVTDLTIADATHPIADGFVIGDTTVYAEDLPMAFGQPGSGAVSVGTSGSQSTLFAYDDGATMTTGTAPARRVAFFASSTGTGSATFAGMALLENAIIWAANLDFSVANEPAHDPSLHAPSLTTPRPNPFTSATTLEFELATASAVSLTVVDAIGRRVAVLAEGDYAPGLHRMEWAPSGLAPGVYLGVLRADGHVVTRRMVLAR